MKTKHSNIITKKRIPLKQLIAYGFGGIIPIALFNIAGQLVGLMGNISLGLSALWLGVILIIPRLWDAVSDPIVGHISDNTRTRWGRRRPFLLVGGIAVAISFVLMWWIPNGNWIHHIFNTEKSYQWFQLGYILVWLLIFFTAVTIFEIPHGALGMEMTTDAHERTRLFSAKSFLGNLFAMSTPWLFALANMKFFKGVTGNEAEGMKYVSIMVAIILIPLSFWWFYVVKEPGFKIVKNQKKTAFWKDMKHAISNKTFMRLVIIVFSLAMGFNFVNLLGYYIPIFYVFGGDKEAAATLLGINGTIWAITGLLAVFPLNWLSPKIGKRKTLILAIGLMILAQLSKIVCYNREYPYLVIIPTILLSSGMLFFFTLGSSMVGDICDEDDLKTGRRSEGSFYSIFWWFIKLGTAFASFVAGLLIVFTQFDENQVIKVDDFDGAISQFKTRVKKLDNIKTLIVKNPEEFLKKSIEYNNETINDLDNFSSKLEIELQNNQKKIQEKPLQQTLKDKNQIINTYISKAADFKSDFITENANLKQLNSNIDPEKLKKSTDKIIPLFINFEIEKVRFKALLLMFHLKLKLSEHNSNEKHYKELLKHLSKTQKQLVEIKTISDLKNIDKKIEPIGKQIKILKQQDSYTLLKMRIVEIGLPIILSLLSLFFTLKYSLTEERSKEIQRKIEERNRLRN